MKNELKQLKRLETITKKLLWWPEEIRIIGDIIEYCSKPIADNGIHWCEAEGMSSKHALSIVAQKAETELCNTKRWYRGSQPLTMYGEASNAIDIPLIDAIKIEMKNNND